MINLRKPYQWEELNESAKKILGGDGSVKVFQSVSHALFEIFMGVKTLYSHKTQFHHSLGLGTHADEALLFLARQGVKAVEFTSDSLPVVDDKKSLFCVADIDDALTGEIYHQPATSAVDQKVFRIWISHQQHFYRPPVLSLPDNDIMIFNAESGLAVAVFGKRGQNLQTPLAPTLNWENTAVFSGFAAKKEKQEWIEKVEKEKWAGAEAFLIGPVQRLYDRALIYWKDLDGGAVRELLVRDHRVAANLLEAFGLSRWNETRVLNQFLKKNLPMEVFRGSLVLSAELSSDSDLRKKIETATEKLKKMSSL